MKTASQLFGKSVPKLINCKKHGPYSGWVVFIEDLGKDIESVCPKCAEKEHAELLKEINDKLRYNQNRTAFNDSCIPPRFAKMSFKEFQPTCEKAAKVKERIGKFIMNFQGALEDGTSFLFSGGTGTGKTHMASAVANNVIRSGYSAVYVSSLNYLSKMKKAWNEAEGLSEDDIVESYVKFDLLVFDELGKGELNAKEKAMIFRLIDRRSEECKPTIGITKFNPQKLVQLIDDDAVRRLKTGGGDILLFDWPPYE